MTFEKLGRVFGFTGWNTSEKAKVHKDKSITVFNKAASKEDTLKNEKTLLGRPVKHITGDSSKTSGLSQKKLILPMQKTSAGAEHVGQRESLSAHSGVEVTSKMVMQSSSKEIEQKAKKFDEYLDSKIGLGKKAEEMEAQKSILDKTNFDKIDIPHADVNKLYDTALKKVCDDPNNAHLDAFELQEKALVLVQDKRTKFMNGIKEIVTTEKSYCQGLKDLKQRLVDQETKLLQLGGGNDELKSKLRDMIKQVGDLQENSESMVAHFSQMVKEGESTKLQGDDLTKEFFSGIDLNKLGDGYAKLHDLAEPMSKFVSAFEKNTQFFADVGAGKYNGGDAKIAEWAEGFKGDWKAPQGESKLTGGAQIILPVQRGPRYEMLANALCETLPSLKELAGGARAMSMYGNHRSAVDEFKNKMDSLKDEVVTSKKDPAVVSKLNSDLSREVGMLTRKIAEGTATKEQESRLEFLNAKQQLLEEELKRLS